MNAGKLLLFYKADPNWVDEVTRETPLCDALANAQNLNMVKMLLKAENPATRPPFEQDGFESTPSLCRLEMLKRDLASAAYCSSSW